MFISSGCTPPKAEVKGKVTYKGSPLKGGGIIIQSSKGTTHSGDIQADGTYVVKDVPTGPAKMTVSWVNEEAIEYNRELLKKGREEKGGGSKGKPKDINSLPTKYSAFDTSGLSFQVQPGTTTFDADLTD
jgi:hypothetical protein